MCHQVIFEGETTWGYEEWDGPLLQIEGTGITITGASGAYLNPDGARWWDGEGGSGGKTKPKFFYAHSLTDSTINNLHIENTPVQAVSIDGASGLTITDMTIDNSAGASEGKNTDGFDIGDSTNVVITGANVYNQDDCVAINSGTVCVYTFVSRSEALKSLTFNKGYHDRKYRVLWRPWIVRWLCRWPK